MLSNEPVMNLTDTLAAARDAGLRASINWERVYNALHAMGRATYLGGAASFPDAAAAHDAGYVIVNLESSDDGRVVYQSHGNATLSGGMLGFEGM